MLYCDKLYCVLWCRVYASSELTSSCTVSPATWCVLGEHWMTSMQCLMPHASGVECISLSINQVRNACLETHAWTGEHPACIAPGMKLMPSAYQSRRTSKRKHALMKRLIAGWGRRRRRRRALANKPDCSSTSLSDPTYCRPSVL